MQKKSLGQHFLKDKKVIEWIIVRIPKHSFVVEVGPGRGALTDHLSKESLLFELDRDLAQNWRDKGYQVIEGDAVKTLKLFLPDVLTNHPNLTVVSNLPYNAAAPIFVQLLRLRPKKLILMFQKEVSDRIVAKFGTREVGRLTVLTQMLYTLGEQKTVYPGAFHPPPKVDSKVIELNRLDQGLCDLEFDELEEKIKILFKYPRKMLRSSGVTDVRFASRRAHELSLNDWVELLKV